MGYFYPPPTVFVGGAQPYGPHLGLPQSGPIPSQPPPLAQFPYQIIASYSQPPVFIGGEQPYAAMLGLASQQVSLGTGPTPTTTGAAVPAGRVRKRPTRYYVRIDGRLFECSSVGEALALLEQAKKLAERYAAAQLEKDDAKPELKAPKITISSRDLRRAAVQTQKEIAKVYADTNRDIEIKMLLALDKKKRDDEDSLMLLL